MSLAIFNEMEGVWRLQRTFSVGGVMVGRAVFKREQGGGLHYREDGEFISNENQVFKAYREYVYRYEEGKIAVYFPDGKPFHTLRFIGPEKAEGSHTCVDDVYHALYTFAKEQFELEYRVTGNSNYMIRTLFTKDSAP